MSDEYPLNLFGKKGRKLMKVLNFMSGTLKSVGMGGQAGIHPDTTSVWIATFH